MVMIESPLYMVEQLPERRRSSDAAPAAGDHHRLSRQIEHASSGRRQMSILNSTLAWRPNAQSPQEGT